MVSSFLFCLVCFLGIGVYSATRKQPTADDYLLAGREVTPWLTALSAVATNNSGFMFIGLIGSTYKFGLSSMWVMVGFICGDYLAWLWIHRRLRLRSERADAKSIPSFLGFSEQGTHRAIVILAALITLAFLGLYAAAQLKAGAKALHVLMDWDSAELTAGNPLLTAIVGWEYSIGVLLGAAIVVAYCFSGGIRASIWTDAAQSIVMLVSMGILLIIALNEIGGMSALWQKLEAIDPTLIDWRPQDLKFGFTLYLIGWMAAGVGVLGQPHIMIRVMAIRSADEIKQARRIYFSWYVAFTVACILVGLTSRVLLDAGEPFDPELALPKLAQQMLPKVLVGLVLAGLFAATISTADSQVLSCSAALTQDLFPQWGKSYLITKAGTVAVTIVMVLFVYVGSKSVFELILFTWSALAGSLGPLLAVRALGKPVGNWRGVAMMISGLAVVLGWRYGLGYSDAVSETLPAMAAGFLVYGLTKPFENDN